MRFVELASVSAAVARTSGRNAKIDLLADALRRLAPEELSPGASYLSGELRQRQTGVGYASLRELPPPAESPSLSITDVDEAFAAMARLAGKGSQAARRELVATLFGAATEAERHFLIGLLSGELRQGAQAGLLVDAVARASGVPIAQIRRALLLAGDLKTVAVDALTAGAEALEAYRLTVGRPLAPMLAQSAATATDALADTGTPAAADIKIDGVRIQVHRDGDRISVFSRSLDDLTARVPVVVEAVRGLDVSSVVLDGEAVGVDDTGRAVPFQETSSRAARRDGTAVLQPFFFDILHLDGVDLLDEPASVRWAALERAVPAPLRVERTMLDTPEEAERVFAAAVAAGHEGLVVKSAAAPYDVGRRGSAWVKVKPRHTLDLVVLAVEWGHGRRKGLLSNLHLGARDPETGGFVMLGKTFKGMTDEMLRWQTERLKALAVEESDWVVKVRPELVVEIAFDGVQTSPRYPGGVALRFARVLRYREDKRADEADTIDAVRAIHTGPSPSPS
ncbi:ATP-dependent DNA ligase [Dactylosporangium aurantiacum]|uniref:Probable DNA ligase n=1 Tax=Dactylosporangium aurantiacum TaxID=35754 RepID=A0A9Q9MLB0_9ACTN|nr:ATP-dependent DNA ligase [Dactylosporangium aurantiacum]MDG6102075.1 ATP-dependent DNA ligase [Dactylosporangium aurantiacum]UWZ53592.1 ATP-dependent DNA ligase [Dactylosporangium aurantiacum]